MFHESLRLRQLEIKIKGKLSILPKVYQILAGDTFIKFIMFSMDQGGMLFTNKICEQSNVDFQWTE